MKSIKKYLAYLAIAIALSSCAAADRFNSAANSTGEKLGNDLASRIPRSAPPPTSRWKVIRVADGDTITVVRGSQKEKIRFCGIDAPESKQPLGKESKAHLQQLINEAKGEVQLSMIESDRYGRQVAEVFTVLGDGKEKFLQEELLKAGLAYHYAKYSSNCPNRDALVDAEAIALANRAGVWSGNYEKPWDYRKHKR